MCTDIVQGVFIGDFLFQHFNYCHARMFEPKNIEFWQFSFSANSYNVWMFYLAYAKCLLQKDRRNLT